MIRRSFRFGLLVGLAAGAAAAIAKLLESRSNPAVPTGATPPDPWPSVAAERATPTTPVPAPPPAPPAAAPPAPPPAPPVTEPAVEPAVSIEVPPPLPPAAPTKRKAPPKQWIEPIGDACPTSHPVKGKLSSQIFHLPGMLNYERTRPDRCYRDADAAEADGLRAALR